MSQKEWKLLTEMEIRSLPKAELQDYMNWLDRYRQQKATKLYESNRKRGKTYVIQEQEKRSKDLARIEELKQLI